MIARLVITILLAYLMGSLSFSYLAVKVLGHADLRSLGTGNLGARNVKRFLGLGAAIAVGIADGLKGVGSVLLGHFLLSRASGSWFGLGDLVNSGYSVTSPAGGPLTSLASYVTSVYPGVGPLFIGPSGVDGLGLVGGFIGAIGAVAGHNYSLFLGFKGGKGLAASAGALLILSPLALLVSLFLGALALIRGWGLYNAALLMAFQLPFTFFLLFPAPGVFWLGLALSLVVLSRHWRHLKELSGRSG